jgi:transposase
MGKPCSTDLYLRAVAAVSQGGLSRHRAAAQFGIGVNTVVNRVRRFQDTGSVAPGRMGGHKPKAIRGEYEVFLAIREAGKAASRYAVSWPSSRDAA